MTPLKVVSLFDGISCGQVALDRAGFNLSSYVALEIDKFPRSITRYQYPNTIHCGDVLEADFTKYVGYDLVMGGSPCTFWSIAKANREVDKDGVGWKLFMCFVEAIQQIKPRYFLYENVASMPKNIKEYISEELGCEPIHINSALVSAQQRKRLYWTNIPCTTQPEDKRILLKDILESGLAYQDKSHCIVARYQGAEFHNSITRKQRTMVAEPLPIPLKDKSQTLCARYYKENPLSMLKRGKTGLFVAEEVVKEDTGNTAEEVVKEDAGDIAEDIGAALRTREDVNGRFKRLEVRHDGKLNALTTVQTDSIICSPIRIGEFGKGGQGDRIYSVNGKTVSLMAHGGGRGAKTGLYKVDLPDGDYTIRKLTPIETERCQTLPDNYTALGIDDKGREVKISNSQRYKAVGNAWTIDVIAHILKHMEVN